MARVRDVTEGELFADVEGLPSGVFDLFQPVTSRPGQGHGDPHAMYRLVRFQPFQPQPDAAFP